MANDYPKQWSSWFTSDFSKAKAGWLRSYGSFQLRQDAQQAGLDVPELPPRPKCTKCGMVMIEKTGKFGAFLACPKSTPYDKHPTQKMPKGGLAKEERVEILPIKLPQF